MSKFVPGLIVGAALAFCSAVQAAPVYCPDPPAAHPDSLSVADVSFAGTNATACYGVATGIANATNIGFDGFAPLLVGATPGGSAVTGALNGVDFTLSASSGTDFGSWTLGWTGGQGALTVDFVAVIQTGLLTFTSYFFDDLVLAASPGSGRGAWAINYVVNEDAPTLAAFSIYARTTGSTEPPPPTPTPVDEPATAALLGLGALFLALARRRRVRA